MNIIGIRELSRSTGRIVGEVGRTGEPTVVTNNGRPVAMVTPVNEEAFEDWVLANAPEFVASMKEAKDDLRAGRTTSLDEVIKTRNKRIDANG